LAAIPDLILDARFDRVDAQLEQACPPAPKEACSALASVSLYWQILLDPDNKQLDGRFNERAAAAITASEAWTRREPQSAEAWFYLAGSYAPLVQWRVLRGQRLSAAREGRKAKDALERTLQLDPTLDDAYFGIGLYHYYADVVPAAAKILRFLLLLPGGDRVQGLSEMLQARQKGALLKGEADYQLHLIYLWYEHQPARAIDCCTISTRVMGTTRCSCNGVQKCSRNTFTTDPPARPPGKRCSIERAPDACTTHDASKIAHAAS
jgi:hypothetical protein